MFRSSISAVSIILVLNIAVFLAWNLSVGTGGLDPEFMINNFLVSWSGLEKGRFWILLTSAFSHNLFFHIFMNMFVLSSFGAAVEVTIGTRRFVWFYLIAAVVSSFCHAAVSATILHNPDLPALGASGAISAVVLLFALFYPQQKILLFGIIPVPALWAVVIFVGLDLWGLIAQAEGGGLPIGHGAHLGGTLVGLFFYFFIYREKRRTTAG